MKIIKINWLSKASLEAELIVSDGSHECLAFSQPCNVQVGQQLIEPLHAMDVDNFMKVIDENEIETIVKSDDSYFAQHCVARVENVNRSIVSVGNIRIEIEARIPSWAKEGDLVEFNCTRLDIW